MLSGDDLTIVLFFIGTAISIACAAVSAAGWRHPLLIGGLFSLSGVCLVVGTGWPSLKTISPPVTAMVGQVATNPVAWFAVLILGMTASILLPKRGNRVPPPSLPAPVPPTKPLTPESTSHPNSPAPVSILDSVQATKHKKIFVNVSPSYLLGLYENRTTLQGDELAAAYIGKWMPVTGIVHDIFWSSNAVTAQIFDHEGKFISASFSAVESEKVFHIAHGETITVRGEIYSSADRYLKLVKCELDLTNRA